MQQTSPPDYYIPESSRLPLPMAASMGLSALGAGTLMQSGSPWLLLAGMCGVATVMTLWFNTAIGENRRGLTSARLKSSFVQGMSWFIFSEVMFFAVFFGALFYVRTLVVPWLGGAGVGTENPHLIWPGFESQWPLMQTPDQAANGDTALFHGPQQHMSFPGWGKMLSWLPLWNTLFLITSSVTCTFAHHALKSGHRRGFNGWLAVTLALALAFLYLQVLEYHHAYAEMGLTLASGIYGSTFFMLTGFHGFHVCVGAIILLVQLVRSLRGHFTADDHFGFEAAAWYWHFVDVVWVALFLFVYII